MFPWLYICICCRIDGKSWFVSLYLQLISYSKFSEITSVVIWSLKYYNLYTSSQSNNWYLMPESSWSWGGKSASVQCMHMSYACTCHLVHFISLGGMSESVQSMHMCYPYALHLFDFISLGGMSESVWSMHMCYLYALHLFHIISFVGGYISSQNALHLKSVLSLLTLWALEHCTM